MAAGRTLAAAFGSALRVVNAYPGGEAFALASAVEVSPGVFYGNENVEDLHRRAVVDLGERFGVSGEAIDLVAGKPAEVILDVVAARKAALVIVGVPQRRGGMAAIVGTTAEAVTAEVPCDVLLVPLPAA